MNKVFFGFILIIAFLGRWQYADQPLWFDEAKFKAMYVDNNILSRETLPGLIVKVLNPESERMLRLPFILFSTFTVLIIWFIIPDRRSMWLIAIMLAIAPIFVWWGALARPYTMALFFCVLGWRWPVFYIPAIITTPYAFTGLNLWKIKERWGYYLILFAGSYLYYSSMFPDGHNHFDIGFLTNAKRLWIIPLCSLMLHSAVFDIQRLQGLFKHNKQLA